MIAPTILSLKLDGEAVGRVLRAAPAIVDADIVPAILESQFLLEREVRDRTPTSGAGTLRDSIGALPIVIGASEVVGEVGTSLSYAQPVESGSKPHRPPVEPIAEWVRRKLGKRPEEAKSIAWAIAGKIAKEGSPGAFMFRDGLAAVQSQILEILGSGVERALSHIDPGRMGA